MINMLLDVTKPVTPVPFHSWKVPMPNIITLNPAAVENLLDGVMPNFSIVSASDRGYRISPQRSRKPNTRDVIPAGFIIPDDLPPLDYTALAARLEDNGDLIIYPVDTPRKPFQPSAKITSFHGEIAPALPKVRKPRVVRPAPAETKPQSFLITKAELDAVPVTVEPEPQPVNISEDIEATVQRWAATPRQTEPQPTLHFAQVETDRTLSGRREREKTITVPVSFDRRRNMGTRPVSVLIKRRRYQ
jgi:hypothetical protein